MVLALRPDSRATSTKLMPRGVPAMGDRGPLGAGGGLASYGGRDPICGVDCGVLCGAARASTSSKERTREVQEREARNVRRDQVNVDAPLSGHKIAVSGGCSLQTPDRSGVSIEKQPTSLQ